MFAAVSLGVESYPAGSLLWQTFRLLLTGAGEQRLKLCDYSRRQSKSDIRLRLSRKRDQRILRWVRAHLDRHNFHDRNLDNLLIGHAERPV